VADLRCGEFLLFLLSFQTTFLHYDTILAMKVPVWHSGNALDSVNVVSYAGSG